jgi:hypothetical protein
VGGGVRYDRHNGTNAQKFLINAATVGEQRAVESDRRARGVQEQLT